MEIEDHWRDKEIVRAITFLDMIHGVLSFGFHLSRLFVFNIVFQIAATPYFVCLLISIAFWLLLFTINILQIVVAARLFVQTNRAEPEIFPALQAARVWFKGSGFLLVLVFARFLIYVLIGDHPGQTFGWILVIAEIALRTLGLYFVKEFLDDLRAELAKTQGPLQPQIPFLPSKDSTVAQV